MAIQLDARSDFGDVVNGLEVATLRRMSGATVALSAALRLATTHREAEPSAGAAVEADAVWRVQLPPGELEPRVGDAILDGADRRWTILELKKVRELNVWECDARDLRVAFGCDDRVDVERAVWDDTGSGPEITGWCYVLTAIPVRIQPEETLIDASVDPPRGEARFNTNRK